MLAHEQADGWIADFAQRAAVNFHIKVLYSAASTTARLGFATPLPLPVAWVEDGWVPPAARLADPCSPLSFVVDAYRGLFAAQLAYIIVQAQFLSLCHIPFAMFLSSDQNVQSSQACVVNGLLLRTMSYFTRTHMARMCPGPVSDAV